MINFRTKLFQLIRQERGGVTAIFMIMLPMLLAFIALALDGSLVMMKKNRLADGLNEGALAIASGAANGDTGDMSKNNALLRQYISYYLPGDEIITADVSTRQATGTGPRAKDTIFDIKAEIKFNTILPMSDLPSFAETLNMNNKGSVRKNISAGRPADYVFVVDFSGSMTWSSSEKNMTRIELLKKVVKDITEKALKEQPESTFGIVPFETGVPIKLEGKNEAGGDRLGCSALFTPVKRLDLKINYDIDYAFWANKNLRASGTTVLERNQRLDSARYNYFNGVVLKALGLSKTAQMVGDPYNFCVLNTGAHGTFPNMPAYHCERSAEESIYTDKNQKIIEDEFQYSRQVYTSNTVAGSIFNKNSIDFAATLENMFDDSAVISFELSGPMKSNVDYSPFSEMCYSRGAEFYAYNIQDYKRNAYLIELTNDKDTIDEFQKMEPQGGTESSVGLLRAVPVLTKGNNPRKVMIVISDGDDNETDVLDSFHKTHNVCEAIRQGMPKHSSVTEEVTIYFISISASSADDSRVKYWGKYCTGMDNSIIAANYSDLMAKLVEITSDGEETGYFNVD